MKTKILIIAEQIETKVSIFAKELVQCAFEINKMIPVSVHAILIGEHLDKAANYFVENGIQVTSIELSTVKEMIKASHLDMILNIIEPIIDKETSSIIITGQNSFSMAFLPQLAIHLNASCITGVKKIAQKDNKIIYTRYICNGKFESQVVSKKKITAISVLPGVFKVQKMKAVKPGTQKQMNVPTKLTIPIKRQSISRPPDTESNFDEADVIVAAGQGIGELENIEELRRFSKKFKRATIAGSRPLIDRGWLPYKYQVGITGKTVAPFIYIACGISGSSQHIAGMGGSEYIVAINSDPNAAIFNVSDLFIVADIMEFIRAFV
jgi:electron transfer flavoprotein alpha subunit